MRIAVVGPQRPDLFADNIVDALRRMGHEPVALGPAFPEGSGTLTAFGFEMARKVTQLDLKVQNRIVEKVKELRPEVLITVESLDPRVVQGVKEAGTRTAFWFPDSVANLGRNLMFLAPYDGLFFKQRSLAERARRLAGVPAHQLLEACNPSWHRPLPGIEPEPVIVLAGAMYPFRVRVLERLVAAGVPLRIFGPPPARWVPPTTLTPFFQNAYLAREDKAREFRRAAAVLDTIHPSESEGYNVRLFEATGCGAATLVDNTPELGEIFGSDEILAFADFDELVDRCRWAIDNLDDARRVGDRAAARAHRDHTYDVRLETIIGKVMA